MNLKNTLWLLCLTLCVAHISAQDQYIYLADHSVKCYPQKFIREIVNDTSGCKIMLTNNAEIFYAASELDSISNIKPKLPQFTSYKFNNRYNDEIGEDIIADISTSSIRISVPSIGKYLTPSFTLDLPNAIALVDGKKQTSMESRMRFDNAVTYLLTCPGYEIYNGSSATEGTTHEEYQEIPLTANMLSTNAPSNYPDTEGIDKILDNDPFTFFHSTWGSGIYQKLPENEHPYISVELTKSITDLQFYYRTRHNADRFPLEFKILASENGQEWVQIGKTDDITDGMPNNEVGADFRSATIHCNRPYKFFRWELVRASHRNYLVLAEFKLYEAVKQDIPTDTILEPWGKRVTVRVNWLADKAQSVPRVDINTLTGEMISSKDYYLKAQISIKGYGMFPDFKDSVQIKGRGNTSWSSNPWAKNPYRLKFAHSVSPIGVKHGKNWCLIANAQHGSMMTNVVSMKMARLVEAAGANHTMPVELYINGQYRGSYMFTEKVGLSRNSIDLQNEQSAVLLELDSYYDERYKFRSTPYSLPVNIKEPDLSLLTTSQATEKFNYIKNDFNRLAQQIQTGSDLTRYVDTKKLARFMFVNDYSFNIEICHPKSTYLYKEDIYNINSKYFFGPVWDFDWAFGYDRNYNYFYSEAESDLFSSIMESGQQFFEPLMRSDNTIKKEYYRLWTNFLDKHQQELLDYINDYYHYAETSFLHNDSIWNDGWRYQSDLEQMKRWLSKRSTYIYNNLETFDLSEDDKEVLYGDVNGDQAITSADLVCLINHLMSKPCDEFNRTLADINQDNIVDITDVVWLVASIMNASQTARNYIIPQAEAHMTLSNIPSTETDRLTVKAAIINDEDVYRRSMAEPYTACQFDISLPEGVELEKVSLSECASDDHQINIQHIHDRQARILVYSDKSSPLLYDKASLTLRLRPTEILPKEKCILSVENVSLTDSYGDESSINGTSTHLPIATAIALSTDASTYHIEGGKCLTITTVKDMTITIHAIDGKFIGQREIEIGETQISLAPGVYMVNGSKIIIY